MKIAEQFIPGEGTTFHVRETHDFTPGLERAKALHTSGPMPDLCPIGSVPMHMITDKLRAMGKTWNDDDALEAAVAEILNEHSGFRIREGKF